MKIFFSKRATIGMQPNTAIIMKLGNREICIKHGYNVTDHVEIQYCKKGTFLPGPNLLKYDFVELQHVPENYCRLAFKAVFEGRIEYEL